MKTDDLRLRTFKFGIRCIRLAEAIADRSATGDVMKRQLIRCGTAVGANYRAASRARSRAEFIAKLGIVEEECDESLYWLDVIAELGLVKKSLLADLQREADELLAITISSIKTARTNIKSSGKY
jgi:four helix bundle protein